MQLCNSPVGYVHSLETFGSVDGPGVRFVVFLQGCALRCKYCHNPETWADGGEEWTVEQLFQRVWRYRNYWGKKGGITVSGGEPLRQMEFLTAFFELARSKGVHTALDTAGQPFRPDDAAYLADFDRLMRSTSSSSSTSRRSTRRSIASSPEKTTPTSLRWRATSPTSVSPSGSAMCWCPA